MNDKTQVVKNRKDIRDLLVSSQSQDVFKAILPQHFTAERMVRLAIAAVTRTPKLGECHPMTLLGAFIECAALGLEPNSPLQHVHLLPFWNSKLNGYEITRIIGYRGYIELAYRTQKQVSLHADCVWQGDEFSFSYGTETHLHHKPKLDRPEDAPPIASYCHVNLIDGQAFLVLPWSDVLRARSRSKAANSGPWVTDLDRMARKTAIRRLYGGGEVPMSIEMAAAVSVDDQPMDYAALANARSDEIREALHSFVGEPEAPPSDDPMDRIVARAEKPAFKPAPKQAFDPETGEVTETRSKAPPAREAPSGQDDTGESAAAAQRAEDLPQPGRRHRRSYREIADNVLDLLHSAETDRDVDEILDDEVTAGVRANTVLMAVIEKAEKTARRRITAAAAPIYAGPDPERDAQPSPEQPAPPAEEAAEPAQPAAAGPLTPTDRVMLLHVDETTPTGTAQPAPAGQPSTGQSPTSRPAATTAVSPAVISPQPPGRDTRDADLSTMTDKVFCQHVDQMVFGMCTTAEDLETAWDNYFDVIRQRGTVVEGKLKAAWSAHLGVVMKAAPA